VKDAWLEGLTVIQISKITKLPTETIKELIAEFENELKSN